MTREIQKYLKQVRDEVNTDMKRYIDAMFEEFRSQVSVIMGGRVRVLEKHKK